MKQTTNEIALFSLFHHDIYFHDENKIDTNKLINLTDKKENISIKELGELLIKNIEQAVEGLNDSEISITLTGGMDSRVILACLLKLGIKPNCLTFGSPHSADVVYAKQLAKSIGLNFHNTASFPPDSTCYKKWVEKVIQLDNGNAHLHRAHRLAAIAEHASEYQPKLLLIGHMGGEGLRGLGYNNYFSSRFFEEVNKKGKTIEDSFSSVLDEYFIRKENLDIKAIIEAIKKLPYMSEDHHKNEFYFLYDLIGNIHHQQDIRLYKKHIKNVHPVYLQENYLTALFSSKHHFLNNPSGILGKMNNPKVHSLLIRHIYPSLLNYPLSKGYKPSEYLKGLWYVVPKKIWRKYTSKKKYGSNFSYGKWYVDFVKEHSENISDEIWEHYDKEKYMHTLYKNKHETNEGYWHKFSNPIFFDLKNKLL